MNNEVVFNNRKPTNPNPDVLLKVTTLLYLKDALFNEEYEGCAELIQAARGFGAQQSEVSQVLTEVPNRGKAGGRNEANPGKKARPRF